jgi:glycosyltransferase involved in cell wall biosynthesis
MPAGWIRKSRPSNCGSAKSGQLLVDVSVIHQFDAGTGIQRVVRSVLTHLKSNPPEGFTVRQVAACDRFPYRYVDEPLKFGSQKIQIQAGDVFLGLDLVAHILPRHIAQLLDWKLAGANLHFVVYDLLPLTHPSLFKAARVRHFQRWAKVLSMMADSLLCISKTVKKDLQVWLGESANLTPQQISTSVIPLGGDFDNNKNSVSQGPGAEVLLALGQLKGSNWALMVGTLEPRKCHAQVLDAFEHLWRTQSSLALVLVGRPGWSTELLQQRIARHPQLNRKLYWFSAASDTELELFYSQTTGVVMASIAEGYGLPLTEALCYGKPILARDIPVFREVAGERAIYFLDDSPIALSDMLKNWLVADHAPAIAIEPQQTWADTAAHIVASLGLMRGNDTRGTP